MQRLPEHHRAEERDRPATTRPAFDARALGAFRRRWGARGIRSAMAACLFSFCAQTLCAQTPTGAAFSSRLRDNLPTLTTTHAAHSLSAGAAARAYPVHLRGVVTNYFADGDKHEISLWMHDATGGIYVSANQATGHPVAGSVVAIEGVSDPGNYAPIVNRARIAVVGYAGLPTEAPLVTLPWLMTGAGDGQWVRVDGVVRSLELHDGRVTLQLAMADGGIAATSPVEPGVDYTRLIDARVRIRANASPLFNANHQAIGARLLFPNLSAVAIVEPAPPDPYTQPVVTVNHLSQFDQVGSMAHRVHLQGRVTLEWLGTSLCIADQTHGICAETRQSTLLKVGDLADVVGFVAIGGSGPMLTDAVFRPSGSSSGTGTPVQASRVTAAEALHSERDANLIQVEGKLIGRDLAAADPTLMLSSDNFIFSVVLPHSVRDAALARWQNGSILRLTGICAVAVDTAGSARAGGSAVPRSFRVLLQSPDDVTILRRPSWWTPTHAVAILSIMLALTLAVLGWVIALRRRVHQQTILLKASEERFRHLAQHDTLTGLATRLLLHDRLGVALLRTKRNRNYLGVLMLDLDKFKQINDTMGHDAGDRTLCVTAERLTQALRESDTVARMGGDEFVVLLADLENPADAETVAAKVVKALALPILIDGKEVPISVSVGVCTVHGGELDAAGLLKCVDTALYRAKARGRNCFEVFTKEMADATVERLRLEEGLARAIERNEFEVHYQPMANLQTGELTGFEALLRWRSQALGLQQPGSFIALAEEMGLIVSIGEWVLREACRQIGLLEREMQRTFLLAVNLSPLQFQQPDLAAMVERVLAQCGRSPYTIELEITESVLMTDSNRSSGALTHLRELGIRMAIDDFGVGFSSLSYITRFSIDRIKIDRSFIENCITDRNSQTVIRAIVAMAHGLGMEVVAEGVENPEQYSFLRQEGCDTVQGYYLSRPVPADQLPALVRQSGQYGPVPRDPVPREPALLAQPASLVPGT